MTHHSNQFTNTLESLYVWREEQFKMRKYIEDLLNDPKVKGKTGSERIEALRNLMTYQANSEEFRRPDYAPDDATIEQLVSAYNNGRNLHKKRRKRISKVEAERNKLEPMFDDPDYPTFFQDVILADAEYFIQAMITHCQSTPVPTIANPYTQKFAKQIEHYITIIEKFSCIYSTTHKGNSLFDIYTVWVDAIKNDYITDIKRNSYQNHRAYGYKRTFA